MTNKKELELKKEINKILLEHWDPIGVCNNGEFQDEYKSYIPSILKLLNNNADEIKIRKQLHQHANVNMGLSSTLEDHTEVAKKLYALKDFFKS